MDTLTAGAPLGGCALAAARTSRTIFAATGVAGPVATGALAASCLTSREVRARREVLPPGAVGFADLWLDSRRTLKVVGVADTGLTGAVLAGLAAGALAIGGTRGTGLARVTDVVAASRLTGAVLALLAGTAGLDIAPGQAGRRADLNDVAIASISAGLTGACFAGILCGIAGLVGAALAVRGTGGAVFAFGSVAGSVATEVDTACFLADGRRRAGLQIQPLQAIRGTELDIAITALLLPWRANTGQAGGILAGLAAGTLAIVRA